VAKTRRLVVIDDSNRTSGFAAEVLAVAAERFDLIVPPRRVTRPDGAVLPFALALDRAVQPGRDHLMAAIHAVLKGEQ
jgi:pyruvate dehydrogenase E1 component beta subunit